MPSKHQPDFSYLRHVPLRRVHLFTLVQITCLAVLWILKSTFMAIIFPVMVGGKTSPLIIFTFEIRVCTPFNLQKSFEAFKGCTHACLSTSHCRAEVGSS